MRGRCLAIILISVAALMPLGCQNDDQLKKLIEESPFKNQAREPNPDIQIVTCNFHPLRLSGQIDITQWPFWSKYDATVKQRTGVQDGSVSIGFPARQLRVWRENGLHVTIAPLSSWSELRKSMVQAGSQALPQTIAHFRRSIDVARFSLLWLPAPTSLLISGRSNAPRALTLPPSDCIFSVNCEPWPGDSQKKTVRIKIVPESHSVLQQQKFGRDEFGTLRIITETPKVIFEELTLSGLVPTDHFICIATKPGTRAAGKLGGLFLSRSEKVENFQLIVVLAPSLKTARQMKAESRGW